MSGWLTGQLALNAGIALTGSVDASRYITGQTLIVDGGATVTAGGV
jgi:hypothetical protein